MISGLPLSLIFFELYEIIWPSFEKMLLWLGISNPDAFLLFCILCVICCCSQLWFAGWLFISGGADSDTEFQLIFSDGISQMVHVGLGIAGAVVGILAKDSPLRNVYEWLLSAYPVNYLYSIELVNLLVVMQLYKFADYDPLKLLIITVTACFFLFNVASYVVVIICGNVKKVEEVTREYCKVYRFYRQKGRVDLLVELPKSRSSEADIDNSRFLVHAKFVDDEGFCHGNSPCQSNCFRDPMRVFKLVEIPDWLLTKLEGILKKQAENPVIVQPAPDYSTSSRQITVDEEEFVANWMISRDE